MYEVVFMSPCLEDIEFLMFAGVPTLRVSWVIYKRYCTFFVNYITLSVFLKSVISVWQRGLLFTESAPHAAMHLVRSEHSMLCYL